MTKKLSDSLYDIFLGGEEWSKLNNVEKSIRVIIMLFVLPIPLIWIGGLHNKEIIEKAKKNNKNTFEIRSELNRINLHNRLKNTENTENIKEVEKQLFNNNLKTEDENIEQSYAKNKRTKVSFKDNLLFVEPFKKLNAQEKCKRSIAFIAVFFILVTSSYLLNKASGKLPTVVFSICVTASSLFYIVAVASYFSSSQIRESAEKLDISTTAIKELIDNEYTTEKQLKNIRIENFSENKEKNKLI